jgi:Mg-chelatase subunit ChlD
MAEPSSNVLVNWRLILGHYAKEQLSVSLNPTQARLEAALDYLYSREYEGRGMRERGAAGSLDASQITVPKWLGEVRQLFPKETVEIIEKHALDRYGLTELVTDKETLSKLEPNLDLLKILLSFRGHLKGDVLVEARRIIRHVVEELKQKFATDVRRALTGKVNRFRRSPVKIAQNFDWRGTLRKNLKNYDTRRQRLMVDQILFFSRIQRRLPWQVILCIDQSGSMASSVIHSAVMAGILAGLPMLKVSLVVFDTAVVDLTGYIDDPVETLMNVQLGGGTDIGQAMTYCERLVENPRRSVIVLVSDFCEGAPPRNLLGSCRRLREAGVKLLGLAALDQDANPTYDLKMAERLAATGMDIAALTPKQLAEWLAKVLF